MFKSSLLAGIYIHIPFCKKACHYCDFHFSTTLNLVDDVVDSIVQETEKMKSYLKEPVETIYFGGGTPSILSEAQFEKITKALYTHFDVSSEAEFTVEANPDDISQEKITFYADLGVNRMSIGTQSFSNDILIYLNRSHSADQTLKAVELCQKQGIVNLSLDLIYGIPGQSEADWKTDLKKMANLDPTHISCYSLTIEEKTAFGNWHKKGKLKIVKDSIIENQYQVMVDFFKERGYEHYEVSNFAKPGFISKHNSSYWMQKPYLGLGPGAHSFNGNTRQFNIQNNPKYVKNIKVNKNPFTAEELSKNQLVTEYIFTKIRTHWGLDFDEIFTLFGYRLNSTQLNFINKVVANKWGTFLNNKLVLNSKGYFISDSIVIELIP